jgi:uncharacterized protein YbjT (DUF2867 family)
VVCLSSLGADKSHGVGPIDALRLLEQKLCSIPSLNLLILRPAYFMENHFRQIPLIRSGERMIGLLDADKAIPQIAARDIGDYAAHALIGRTFSGKSTRELLGERDIAMSEVATIIGKTIGKPHLRYSPLPPSFVERHMKSEEFSERHVRLSIEVFESLNNGWLEPTEMRSQENTTATSFERFVAEAFLPLYVG